MKPLYMSIRYNPEENKFVLPNGSLFRWNEDPIEQAARSAGWLLSQTVRSKESGNVILSFMTEDRKLHRHISISNLVLYSLVMPKETLAGVALQVLKLNLENNTTVEIDFL